MIKGQPETDLAKMSNRNNKQFLRDMAWKDLYMLGEGGEVIIGVTQGQHELKK